MKRYTLAVVTVGNLCAQGALAVEPAPIKAGPVYIVPTVKAEARYVDNIFRSARDEKSSWVSDVRPRVQAWLKNGNNTYSLAYELADYRYFSSHDDDYTDHRVNLDIHHEFNARNTLNAYAEYFDAHEERGTGLAEGGLAQLIDKPVEYEQWRWGGDYTYGSRSADGRLTVAYDYLDLDYQNFRDVTRYRDREQDTLKGTFFWKVAPRTDALVEVRYIDNEYDRINPADPGGSYDSEEWNYFAGVEWQATAKTSGSVRLGWYDRSYDSRRRSDDDGFSWEVDVDYKPRSYSNFNFGTRRFSEETNGLGDAIDVEEYQIRWDHDWSGRSRTEVRSLWGDDDYTGYTREDERWQLEAKYLYNVDRWFDIGGGYRYEDRDSDRPSFDYSRNVYFIEAELSL
ncbi:outer membrane beta-barrel protein [Pseudohalioglobus sediminis]|uniref:outer membrane beta-barrel protein n=1 Tax=Pseudohalioglobus sediminis TaxID=2606449 RepID=UPI00165F1768|nr:outer membrane beta-barrel protein [Pseudohalioglobus sediminis]